MYSVEGRYSKQSHYRELGNRFSSASVWMFGVRVDCLSSQIYKFYITFPRDVQKVPEIPQKVQWKSVSSIDKIYTLIYKQLNMNNNIKVTIIEYWGIDTLATLCEPTTYYEAVKTTNMGFYQLCGSIWVNINGEPQEAVIRDISLTMKEGELLGVTLAVSLLK